MFTAQVSHVSINYVIHVMSRSVHTRVYNKLQDQNIQQTVVPTSVSYHVHTTQ